MADDRVSGVYHTSDLLTSIIGYVRRACIGGCTDQARLSGVIPEHWPKRPPQDGSAGTVGVGVVADRRRTGARSRRPDGHLPLRDAVRGVDLYARDDGGLGVMLSLDFWIAFRSAIIVWAASLSPALADRRELRRTQ